MSAFDSIITLIYYDNRTIARWRLSSPVLHLLDAVAYQERLNRGNHHRMGYATKVYCALTNCLAAVSTGLS